MICQLYASDMHDVITGNMYFFMVSSKRAVCLENLKKKYALAQLYELFQVLQEFSTKN